MTNQISIFANHSETSVVNKSCRACNGNLASQPTQPHRRTVIYDDYGRWGFIQDKCLSCPERIARDPEKWKEELTA